jgi:hypothetical protein
MTERNPTPADWPTALPPPTSPDLPAAVIRWLYEVVPADRWRHEILADDPWTLALMATATLRREIDSLRASWGEMKVFGRGMDPDTLGRTLDGHKTEAARLVALKAQVELVEMELLHASARTKTRRLKG